MTQHILAHTFGGWFTPWRSIRQVALVCLTLFVTTACGVGPSAPDTAASPSEGSAAPTPVVSAPDTCPARGEAVTIPDTHPDHQNLAYWLQRLSDDGIDADEVLMAPAAIDASNRVYQARDQAFDLSAPVDEPAVRTMATDRITFVVEQLRAANYVQVDGQPFATLADQLAAWSPVGLDATPVVALGDVQMLCTPTTDAMYTPALDLRFNRNHCSTLRTQEPALLLGAPMNGLRLVMSRYSLGWVPESAALAPLSAPHTNCLSERGWLPEALNAGSRTLPAYTEVCAPADSAQALIFTAAGSSPLTVNVPASTPTPMTRRHVLEAAFSYLDAAYGWGGTAGGLDCSDFTMSLLARFGLRLPRFSAHQGRAGLFTVVLPESTALRERLAIMDAAHAHGVVLLHFPGHVMLYLGRDADGEPRVIHSFAEYLVPCDEPEQGGDVETLFTVDRVTVTGMHLGEGSSRRSFLQRLTHISVLGNPADASLSVLAAWREPAPVTPACDDTPAASFISPLRPHAQGEVRVIGVSDHAPGPVQAVAIAADGRRIDGEVQRLGGPPWGVVATFDLTAGEYQAVIGDGANTWTCASLSVSERPTAWVGGGGGAWPLRNTWTRNVDQFFSLWVEALFDYPLEDEMTWPNLHSVLRSADHNLLFNHYGLDEEAAMRLAPDCADLPYLLRGYFAWKLGLPFGYRACGRGRAGRPPSCGDLVTQESSPGQSDPVSSFTHFMNRGVRNGVHSGSGRTSPTDDNTDWYPVDISRDGIRPGTLFADPYGHLMVVTQWVPPALGSYGILMAADAQPDATVGRPRFWRGTFLFSTDTDSVGAGFKAWRPIVRESGSLRQLTNDELSNSTVYPRWSDDQYTGTLDSFYDRMEAVINPRALDPLARLGALLDALHESVNRRVISVNNAQEHLATTGRRTIDMPDGSGIFLTVGPWEDFSTPSRDMRLLIAIDTVLRFPEVVRTNPHQFGLRTDEVEAEVSAVQQALEQQLQERTMEYAGSDGRLRTLTLAQIVERALQFEIAYNPNDCPEVRWGAPDGSDDAAACQFRAPAAQRQRMTEYRSWFALRQRPGR
jgi:cell wall-associated NlpC family hydrolase